MAWKKTVKRVAKKAGRAVKRRYFKGKGYSNPKINTMARDIMTLKRMINAEKQNAETTDTTLYTLAQYNGVNSGRQIVDILPVISQGVGEDNRKGDSLKICSWAFKLHIETNSFNTLQPVKYRFYLLRQPTNPQTVGIVASQFLENNPFSGVVDYHSNRDYEHFKDYIVMGVIDSGIGTNTNDSLNQIKTRDHILARKQQFHIRYDKGTNLVLNNPIYLLAVASDGDRATTNLINFKYSFKVYYYDN